MTEPGKVATPKKRSFLRWSIANEYGLLYVGQRLTRDAAIAEHVAAIYGTGRFANGLLDAKQLKAWEKCQAAGDRAVKVKITILGGRA
jgi:hypothetical protein